MQISAISGHKTWNCFKRYTHMRAERLAQKLLLGPVARLLLNAVRASAGLSKMASFN